VIINDLDVECGTVLPDETKTPLIVDSDAVLPAPPTFEQFKAILRRDSQILQPNGNFQLPQLAQSYTLNVDKPRYALAFVQRLSISAFE